MTHLPFSLSKRTGRRFFYVQFKNEKGEYLPAVSTGQISEAAAMETAFKWLREGRPAGSNSKISLPVMNALREIKFPSEAEFVCRDLKRRGLLKSYVLAGSKQAVDFPAYLRNFWDYDASPYVKEKLRKSHGIHRNYTRNQKLAVEKHWVPFFEGRFLGDITRQDIENFMDFLSNKNISAGEKKRDTQSRDNRPELGLFQRHHRQRHNKRHSVVLWQIRGKENFVPGNSESYF